MAARQTRGHVAARVIADSIKLGLRPTLIGQAIDTAARQALITAEQEADARPRGLRPRDE